MRPTKALRRIVDETGEVIAEPGPLSPEQATRIVDLLGRAKQRAKQGEVNRLLLSIEFEFRTEEK